MKITAEEKLLENVDSKLQTVITHNDELEAHHVTAHGHLSDIHTKINTHNDATIRGINNTGSIGDGSTNATTVSLGYDRSNGKARALLVDSTGKLEVNNSDVEGLLGTIATNTSNINLNVDTLEVNTDGLETLVTATNSALSTIDSVLDASLVKQGAVETLVTATNSNQGTMITHLSEIEGAVETLEGCVGSSKVNVNISSGNISGFSTATHQTTIIGHLDGLEGLITSTNSKIDTFDAVLDASLVKQTNIETLITTLDGVQDNALTKLGEIDTAIDTIDSVLDASLVKQTNLETLITSTNSKIDTFDAVLDASLVKQTNIETLITTLDGVQDNALTKLGEIDTAIDTIDSVLDASLVKQTNLETLITSTNSKIDTFDAVLDASLVKQTNIETKVGEIDTVLDNIKVDTEAIETAVEILDDIVLTEDTAHSSGDKGVMFLGVHQSSQADFGADGDYVPLSINDDGELRVTSGGSSSSATGQFLATGTTLSSYSLSAVLDVSAYKNVRLMGKESGGSVSSIPVYGSQTSGGTYYGLANDDWLNSASVQESGSGTTNHMSAHIESTPKFLKIFNNTGSDITIEIDYVAHK